MAKGADDPHTKYYIACLYVLRGDVDRGLRYLEDSLQHLKTINTIRAKNDPDLRGLRDDPRFNALIAA